MGRTYSNQETVDFYRALFDKSKEIENYDQRLDAMNIIYGDFISNQDLLRNAPKPSIWDSKKDPKLGIYVAKDTKPLHAAIESIYPLKELSTYMVMEICDQKAEDGDLRDDSHSLIIWMAIGMDILSEDPYHQIDSELFCRLSSTLTPEQLDRQFTI